MPYPSIEQILIPLLKITKDSKTYNTERAIRFISSSFELSEKEKELTFDGDFKIIRELVRIGRDHLRGAGLIEGANRNFHITKIGTALLKTKPNELSIKDLSEYPEYKAFWKEYKSYHQEQYPLLEKAIAIHNAKQKLVKIRDNNNLTKKEVSIELSSEEVIEQKYKALNEKLKIDLLEKVKNLPPELFEDLCVLLVKHLIYTKEDNIKLEEISKALGKTGDGGIDGIVSKKDKIKTSRYYIQAKCWKNVQVGRPEIQKFVGALAGKKARDGIFITTSKFATTAEAYVKEQSDYDIKLIDGNELIELMIEHEIGVQTIAKYEIKSIDGEFFNLKRRKLNTRFQN
ncbi:MAG: restriction endonuclease [Flavobacterium sp.]|nr:restriction endonuclease [Flavobacterium sp.]